MDMVVMDMVDMDMVVTVMVVDVDMVVIVVMEIGVMVDTPTMVVVISPMVAMDNVLHSLIIVDFILFFQLF